MENIDMFLLDPSNGDLFQFPVNPPKIQIKGEAIMETVEIARIGEIDWFAGNKRTQLNWESFFPGHYDPHYCRYFLVPDPLEAHTKLVNWRVAGKVLRLIVTGEHKGARKDIINVPVLIASYGHSFQGGEPDDLYFDIAMRQYREVQIRTAAEGGTFVPPRLDLVPVPVDIGGVAAPGAAASDGAVPPTDEAPRFRIIQGEAGITVQESKE